MSSSGSFFHPFLFVRRKHVHQNPHSSEKVKKRLITWSPYPLSHANVSVPTVTVYTWSLKQKRKKTKRQVLILLAFLFNKQSSIFTQVFIFFFFCTNILRVHDHGNVYGFFFLIIKKKQKTNILSMLGTCYHLRTYRISGNMRRSEFCPLGNKNRILLLYTMQMHPLWFSFFFSFCPVSVKLLQLWIASWG